MTWQVRALGPTDVSAYRTLRLRALRTEPEAFGDSVEEAQRRPDDHWHGLFADPDNRCFFGAMTEQALAGTANLMRERGRKSSHKGWLLGMYVDPAWRGAGCGAALIEAIIARARQMDIIQLHLGVGAQNNAAKRLYESAGFAAYGTEPRALQVDGRFIDEIMMVKHLDQADGRQ